MRRALILGLALSACSPSAADRAYETVTIEIDNESLQVWLGDEPAERRVGLMNVDRLPRGIDGMLFAWSEPTTASFRMQDTPIALDIWWFDSMGLLIGSAEMEPCLDSDCVTYRSPGQVKWALETPLGDNDFLIGSSISTVENG